MNKRIKWGIIILIGAGLAGLGIYQFTPHENEELTAADALPKENKQRTLKVNAQVIFIISVILIPLIWPF